MPTALGVHIFAGGFTCGVRAAGFRILGHLEDTPYGVESARRNFPGLDVRVGEGDWREAEFAGRVDFLYSNPPCFSASTAVKTERGWRRIGDIVRERSGERIACVDGGRIVWREVGGWHKNPHHGGLYDVRLVHGAQGGKGLTLATINHRFLTRRGWVPVALLRREDEVCTGRPTPNRAQLTLIDGMLLGDGKLNRQPQLSTSQTCEELVRLKHAALRGLVAAGGVTVNPKVCKDGMPRRDQATFTSSTDVWTRQQRARWYPDGVKRVPADILLTDITLAAWYMDDGRGRNLTPAKVMNYQGGGRRQGAYADFAICGFDEEDAGLLIRKLAEVGLTAEVRRRKTGYLDLRIARESAAEFFRRIGRFVPSSMRYKLPPDAPPFDPRSWELGEPDVGWDRVTRRPAKLLRGEPVYCIDVPGPQNFVTRNGVAHNCAIFSSAGIATTRGKDGWRTDPRLGCWYRAYRVFEAVRPKVFALESVCQAYTKGREVVDDFTRRALGAGYSVTHLMIDTKWTGLPQSRKRFFFVAYRPDLPLEFRFDYASHTTVGQVLAAFSHATEPGPITPHTGGANFAQWIPMTGPGEKLRQAYDRAHDIRSVQEFSGANCTKQDLADTPPGGYIRNTFDRKNPGKKKGRPGFMYTRLHPDRVMGAFTGDLFAHPTEDRFLGTNEMKALCGYPQDFWLEGKARGHASFLARAVLPPVGQWLAGSVRKTMSLPRRVAARPSVMKIDLRREPGSYTDLTPEYLTGYSTPRLSLLELTATVKSCDACPRMRGRTRVFGQTNGPAPARVFFIGEAPGKDGAGLTGLPFYGDASGVNFDLLLQSIGLTYDDVFVTNSVLCNPLGPDGLNDAPNRSERENCSGHLRRTIEVVDPEVIVTVGATALESLSMISPHQFQLGKVVGRAVEWNGYQLIPVYHPSPRVTAASRTLVEMKKDWAAVRTLLDVAPPYHKPQPEHVMINQPTELAPVRPELTPPPPEPQSEAVVPGRPVTLLRPKGITPIRQPPVHPNGSSEGTKLPGEKSGEFIRRLWMTGKYTPEQILELVHKNWEGRKTKVADIYWNYGKLLQSGVANVPPWPSSRRTIPGPTAAVARVAVSRRTDPRRPKPVENHDDGRPRFLLTGSTPMQCGSDRTQLKIITAAVCWKGALEYAGYRVDWRPVKAGEDLSAYAGVGVILNKPNSITSNYFPGAAWVVAKRPDTVLMIDDWQVGELVSGLQTCARSEERLFRLRGFELPASVKAKVFEVTGRLAAGNWQYPVIVPTFNGGDIERLGIPAKVITGIDPTAFAPRYTYPAVTKERAWVQASLLRKPAPATAWKLECYGNSDRGEGGIGKAGADAQPRLAEPELAAVYARAWGILSPAHPHAGSGWWRVRFLMAADAGSVLSADPAEAAVFGEPYLRASDPRAVERLTDRGLANLAAAQKEVLEKAAWPKHRVTEELVKTLRLARQAGRPN